MSEDLIRRSDAIKAMGDYLERLEVNRRYAKSVLNKVPSVKPKRGEWIQTSNDWIDGTCGTRYYPIHCSICNYSTYDDSATNFCPNCGARMKGADDE